MTLKHILQGRFMKHPLHPMLVHLPIGLWVASLVFDLLYMVNGSSVLSAASFYVIGFGIVGALLATVPGFFEFIDIPRHTLAFRIGMAHMSLNLLVVALYVVGFFLRGNLETGSDGIVTGTELVLNIVSIGFLSVSGYLGGTLVFQHGIGLRPETDETRSREDISRAA